MTGTWTLLPSVLGLAVAVVVLAFAGGRLAQTADQLAERTGLGQAMAGAVFLGAVTSLSGILTTVAGAMDGDAGFALANPIGGVAIQTVWIAIADLVYRRANLEHAGASLENILQALLLIAMLTLPVIAVATPELAWGWVHPMSLLIPPLYAYGLMLLRGMRDAPMWSPRITHETTEEEVANPSSRTTRALWVSLATLAGVVSVVGWVIGKAGLGVVAATGWPSAVTGFTLTTAVTSLPELFTLIAAVRMGSVMLGIGGIVGGNVFDTLMITIADVVYTPGTIYAAAGPSALVLLGGTALITTILALGLIVRDRRGIGFEGIAIPAVYLGTVALAILAA
ncbi:hypothetical protein [Nocardioides sp.]|uniref:sodium:calcium antiporter n=1 Tax=Nocardioides sp. TaxID=35761 RepID=UPI002B279BF6|nr:hypothetical protein [Nocardioides sp.]